MNKRTFMLISIDNHVLNRGRYLSNSPLGAAKKALTSYAVKNKKNNLSAKVVIKETTKGSRNKQYAYRLKRESVHPSTQVCVRKVTYSHVILKV